MMTLEEQLNRRDLLKKLSAAAAGALATGAPAPGPIPKL